MRKNQSHSKRVYVCKLKALALMDSTGMKMEDLFDKDDCQRHST